jgi:hypothetical protein
MLFSTLTTALAAEVFLAATGGRFSLTDTDTGWSGIAMTFVALGNIVVAYVDDTSGQGWTVACDFQEVV